MDVALVVTAAALGLVGIALAAWGLARSNRTSAATSDARLTRRVFLASSVAAIAVGIMGAARLAARPPIAVRASPSSAPSGPAIGAQLPRLSASGSGLWISREELADLSVGSPAFVRLLEESSGEIPKGALSDQDSPSGTITMQLALVAARMDDDHLRGRVRDALMALVGTENGSTGSHAGRNRLLGIGRNLPPYVMAADLIGLRSFDGTGDRRFRAWLDELRTKRVDDADSSLADAEPRDHSNWGAYIGAAMTAANLYLADRAAITNSADILRGWVGDRQGRQDWLYDTDRHDYSWECHYPDVDRYLPVNPKGCERDGFVIDGVIPIDMQRGDGFRVPPKYTQYPRESLQGRTVAAELLHRAGYDSYAWADAGLVRIARRLLAFSEFDSDWYEPAMGCYWILAARTGEDLPLEEPATGRAVAGVDWTFGPEVEGRARRTDG